MSATPTIFIAGTSISGQRMTKISVGDSYQYVWDVDNGNNTAPSDGTYTATVSGTDLAGNPYSVTESITFTLDTTGPTVILTDTDTDNLIPLSASVTITAAFSESLLSTPTLSLTGLVTNALMTRISSTNSYTYLWSVSPSTNSGIYTATALSLIHI